MPETLNSDEVLLERDRHLFAPGRKAILSIDGGGIRGLIALGFLTRLESLLTIRAGAPVRLCDRFDLIGGTSTGAIVARRDIMRSLIVGNFRCRNP